MKIVEIDKNAEPFSPGDLVRLRSGSPYMTVIRCAGGIVDALFWVEPEFHTIQGVTAAAFQRLGESGELPDDIPLQP